MIVDYDWITTLLAGSITYRYYDVNNVERQPNETFNIKYVDLRFNVSKPLLHPWFIITPLLPDQNKADYFTFSTSENGVYSQSLSVDLNSIAANGTLRIYIRCVDYGDETARPVMNIKFTPGGQWNPPYWQSAVVGYQLVKAVQSLTFQQYDKTGAAQAPNNNFNIGSMDLIIDTDRVVNNATVTIGDLAGSQVAGGFLYSNSPDGPWYGGYSFATNLGAGRNVRRIYMRVASWASEVRVQSRANVSVTWGRNAQLINQSPVAGYQVRVYQDRRFVGVNMVAENWYGVGGNLISGQVSPFLSHAGDNHFKTLTDYITGAVWYANIEYHNAHDDFDVIDTWINTMPGLAVPGIEYASAASIRAVQVSGRNNNLVVELQPTKANGWAYQIRGRDNSSGEAEYFADVYLTVYW